MNPTLPTHPLAAAVFTAICFQSSAEPSPTREQGGADHTMPVEVFIMMGQDAMLGMGAVGPEDTPGTLRHAIAQRGKYFYLMDGGEWAVRNDVRYVLEMPTTGRGHRNVNTFLTVPKEGFIGPELGIGHFLGEATGAPVLLLKACAGNRALGWDLLPPGSERFEFEGRVYPGYGESPKSWPVGSEPVPIDWYAGKQYDDDTANAKKVLGNLRDYYPGYQGQGYEIAGFFWWQGHKDRSPAYTSRYEENLVRLIKALREDFDAPEAKFVIATGCGDSGRNGNGLQVADAQLAVDGHNKKYAEFAGNVAVVDSRLFWQDTGPVQRHGHHYFRHAEVFMDTGELMGRAMVDLLGWRPGQ